GGPLDAELAASAIALGLAPSQTYGLSESASMATLADDADDAGAPLPGLDLRIAGAQADGIGRIELRGPMLFAGYEDDGVLVEPRAADAWFDTGDLGSIDPRGRLSVRCRRTDLILSGGENIYPAQVEAALMRHPGIADAAVFALPDPEWGQAVVALLVARREPLADADVTAHAVGTLAPFQRPRHWRWLSDLPRTASGKVARSRLADAFASASAGQTRCQVMPRLDSPDRMSVPSIVSEEIDGIRAISFQRDERGQANQEMVRLYFSNEFLKSTSGVRNLVIDLTGVISLDSAALGPLVQKLREVHDLDGRMALAGVASPALKEIFALTRFDKVFPMYPSRQEAMTALAGAR
ncbi:MAG: AMP-binding protein, partial [Planctomycetes bacterium]|nr:AMP-binding protein [Planctomycetota bacterium]